MEKRPTPMEQLLKRGKERGFLTYEELNDSPARRHRFAGQD